MVEHEATLSHLACSGHRGAELMWEDQQVVAQISPGHFTEAGQHSGTGEPCRVGFVLRKAADPDQP